MSNHCSDRMSLIKIIWSHGHNYNGDVSKECMCGCWLAKRNFFTTERNLRPVRCIKYVPLAVYTTLKYTVK